MPHAALDLSFHSNPKVLSAGLAAKGLYAMSLSYWADHLTDGLVPGLNEIDRRYAEQLRREIEDLGKDLQTRSDERN
jgi:hypothetical protein